LKLLYIKSDYRDFGLYFMLYLSLLLYLYIKFPFQNSTIKTQKEDDPSRAVCSSGNMAVSPVGDARTVEISINCLHDLTGVAARASPLT
jgi:hypothetical protein